MALLLGSEKRLLRLRWVYILLWDGLGRGLDMREILLGVWGSRLVGIIGGLRRRRRRRRKWWWW